jgi:hypothetical protein
MSSPKRAAGRPDPPGGQQDIDPATRTKIEDALALVEVRDRGRVAAAERSQDGSVRKLAPVERGIQLRTDWFIPRCTAIAARRPTAAAA